VFEVKIFGETKMAKEVPKYMQKKTSEKTKNMFLSLVENPKISTPRKVVIRGPEREYAFKQRGPELDSLATHTCNGCA